MEKENKKKKRNTLVLMRCVLECRLLFPYASFRRWERKQFFMIRTSRVSFFDCHLKKAMHDIYDGMGENVFHFQIESKLVVVGQVSWGASSCSRRLWSLSLKKRICFSFQVAMGNWRSFFHCFFRWLTMPLCVESIHVGT